MQEAKKEEDSDDDDAEEVNLLVSLHVDYLAFIHSNETAESANLTSILICNVLRR